MRGIRKSDRGRVTVPVLLSLLLLGVSGASATATQNSACRLQPIALPLFDATPAATIAQTPVTDGDAPDPDAETIEAAADTIIECANMERQAERYAVFTDRFLANQFTGDRPLDQPAFERRIATGAAPEPGAFTLLAVHDIEPREDGRVAVTLEIETPEGIVRDRLILAWDSGARAWLIDGMVELQGPDAPEE